MNKKINELPRISTPICDNLCDIQKLFEFELTFSTMVRHLHVLHHKISKFLSMQTWNGNWKFKVSGFCMERKRRKFLRSKCRSFISVSVFTVSFQIPLNVDKQLNKFSTTPPYQFQNYLKIFEVSHRLPILVKILQIDEF